MSKTKNTIELKPYDFKVGKTDSNNTVVRKIYSKFQEYIVYRTDNEIRINIDDDSESHDEILKNHQKISTNLARIYSWLPENLSWSEPINKQIARAMVTNAAGNYNDALIMLNHAEERIFKLKTIQGRLQYTISAFLLVGIIFFINISLNDLESKFYTSIILCGSLGGLLSIGLGFNKLSIDNDANWQTNCLVGGSRVLIAMIASLVAFFAIQSDIAFTFVKDVKNNYGIFMMAMVAGFAERLIPNLMSNIAKQQLPKGSKSDEK